MPSAYSNAARAEPRPSTGPGTGSRSNPGFQPRGVKSRAPLSRIRWDRAQRLGLIAVIVLVGYLGITGVASLISTHSQAAHGLVEVRQLAQQERQLVQQQKSLSNPTTILRDARTLGMVRQGEQSFVVTP